MYRALFEEFGKLVIAKQWADEPISAAETRFFTMILTAREESGHRLLGSMAGPDACIDTVTGRCGHRPRFETAG